MTGPCVVLLGGEAVPTRYEADSEADAERVACDIRGVFEGSHEGPLAVLVYGRDGEPSGAWSRASGGRWEKERERDKQTEIW